MGVEKMDWTVLTKYPATSPRITRHVIDNDVKSLTLGKRNPTTSLPNQLFAKSATNMLPLISPPPVTASTPCEKMSLFLKTMRIPAFRIAKSGPLPCSSYLFSTQRISALDAKHEGNGNMEVACRTDSCSSACWGSSTGSEIHLRPQSNDGPYRGIVKSRMQGGWANQGTGCASRVSGGLVSFRLELAVRKWCPSPLPSLRQGLARGDI